MNKKLEEFFNVDSNKKPDENKNEIVLNDASDSLPTINQNQLDLNKFDKEMDDIANQAMQGFEEIMMRAESVEDKDAGSIYRAASDLMKNALNAKTQKVKARLDSMSIAVKVQKSLEKNLEDHPENSNMVSRAEILSRRNSSKNQDIDK